MGGKSWFIKSWLRSRSEHLVIQLADWLFRVDKQATRERTTKNSLDHCECSYCKNYYDTVEMMHPKLSAFLGEFGINMAGPSELMPFEPTLMLACYRVQGQILEWGKSQLYVDDVQITPETGADGTFLLWVGEMALPWVQEENVEDVVSPANLPEFLERMREVWYLRHGNEYIFS